MTTLRPLTRKFKDNPRAQALVVLDAVLSKGRSLSSAMPAADSVADRSMVMELCYGTLRWMPWLEALADSLLRKPLRKKDRDIHYLILLGLYQLIYMRIPPYAVVDETVSVAKGIGKVWSAALINSVLRNFQRQRETLESSLMGQGSVRYAHPDWLCGAIKKAWPADWEAILMSNQERPPMTLRVNTARIARDDYLKQFDMAGIQASAHAWVDSAIVLANPVDVSLLPGFAAGDVSVQDAAAQYAATLLDMNSQDRVLDACAAPGGKTGHLFEVESDIDVVALDVESERLQRVAENLSRLQCTAQLICGDAVDTQRWWDGGMFDRILLDAPCSATGVVRRHPDIKYLRKPEDIDVLVGLQRKILTALWPLLKPGGKLVYATCSIFPQENHLQMAHFLAHQHDATELALDVPWGRPMPIGRQILNCDCQGLGQSMDGFYYACIGKQG